MKIRKCKNILEDLKLTGKRYGCMKWVTRLRQQGIFFLKHRVKRIEIYRMIIGNKKIYRLNLADVKSFN